MSDKQIINAKRTIKSLFNQKKIELNKIILFGSYARNEQDSDSDLDLLIVSKSFRNKSIDSRINMALGLSKKLVNNIDVPFDILYYSDEEWENSNSLILGEVKENGKMIYEMK